MMPLQLEALSPVRSSIRRRAAAIVLAVLAVLFPFHAWAATSTTTFAVSAVVISTCAIAANPLSFGSYNPVSGSPLDATTTLTATCTLSTSYTIGLDDGANVSSGQRRMALLTAFLNYELYSDSGRTQRWGNSGAQLVSGTGNGAAQSHTVYGRVPASQAIAAGSYVDTITVTITF